MMATHNWLLVLGFLATAAVGCAQIEPSVNAGVDATKSGIDRADAFLSGLVGEKPAKTGAQESSVRPLELKVH